MGGGTLDTIWAIKDSDMTPGPLGILETKPKAEAPYFMAVDASSWELIQHIFTRSIFLLPDVSLTGAFKRPVQEAFYVCSFRLLCHMHFSGLDSATDQKYGLAGVK